MSEENNKIEINKLLEAANVKNLSKYFKNPAAECSINDLLDTLRNEMNRGKAQLDSEVVSEVFALVIYIWKHYKDKQGDLQLGAGAIFWMFGTLGSAIEKDSSEGGKSKSQRSVEFG